jgi:kynurenine formamidase
VLAAQFVVPHIEVGASRTLVRQEPEREVANMSDIEGVKKRRIIDLSITLESNLPSDPSSIIPKIQYEDHIKGVQEMGTFFPGITRNDLPEGMGWAIEYIILTTHSGTHMDAPYHYHPTTDWGKPAPTIDEIPLEWFFSDGVVLDFHHKADGDEITAKDIEKELQRIKYEIKPMDIVLIQTGADGAWGSLNT